MRKRPRREPERDENGEQSWPSPMIDGLLSPRLKLNFGKSGRKLSGFVKMRQRLRTPYSAAAPPLSDLLSLRLMESAADALQQEKRRIESERLRLEKRMKGKTLELPSNASARELAYCKLRKLQAEATIEVYRELADESSSWLTPKALSHIPGFTQDRFDTPGRDEGKVAIPAANPDEAAAYFASGGDVCALSAAVKSANRRLRGLGNKKSHHGDMALCCLDILERLGPLLAAPLRDGISDSARVLRQVTYCDVNTVALFQRMVGSEDHESEVDEVTGNQKEEGKNGRDEVRERQSYTNRESSDTSENASQFSSITPKRMLYSTCRDETLRVLEKIEEGIGDYGEKVRKENVAVNTAKSELRTLKADTVRKREILGRSEHHTVVLTRERGELISGMARLQREVEMLKENVKRERAVIDEKMPSLLELQEEHKRVRKQCQSDMKRLKENFDTVKDMFVSNDKFEKEKATLESMIDALERQKKIHSKHIQKIAEDTQRRGVASVELDRTRVKVQGLRERSEMFNRCYTPRPNWERDVIAFIPTLRAKAERFDRHRRKSQLPTFDQSMLLQLAKKKTDDDIKIAEDADLRYGRSHSLAMALCREIRRQHDEADIAAKYGTVVKNLKQAKADLKFAEKELKDTVDSMPFLVLDYDDLEADGPHGGIISDSKSGSSSDSDSSYSGSDVDDCGEVGSDSGNSRKPRRSSVRRKSSLRKGSVEEQKKERRSRKLKKGRKRKERKSVKNLAGVGAAPGARKDPEFFIALGTGKHVPPFLRYKGRVRNRKIAKADLEVLVQQIWNERRMQRMLEANDSSSLSDFFYKFLRQRFGVQQIIAEWGYNILFGLEKYIWDADLELFLLCLTGAVSEAVYDDQMHLLYHLQKVMKRIDAEYLKEKAVHGLLMQPGLIQREDLEATLRVMFPSKTTHAFNQICKALEKDCQKSNRDFLKYNKLFDENDGGDQGHFIEEVRDQHLREVQEFTMKIERAIQKRDTYNKGKILIVDIREAIQSVDRKISSSALEEYLARGLQCDLGEVRWDVHVDYDIFFSQLKLGLLKKTNSWVPDPPLQMPSILRARARAIRRRETQRRRKLKRAETRQQRRESKKRNNTIRTLEEASDRAGTGNSSVRGRGNDEAKGDDTGHDDDHGAGANSLDVAGWDGSAPSTSEFGSPMGIPRVLEMDNYERGSTDDNRKDISQIAMSKEEECTTKGPTCKVVVEDVGLEGEEAHEKQEDQEEVQAGGVLQRDHQHRKKNHRPPALKPSPSRPSEAANVASIPSPRRRLVNVSAARDPRKRAGGESVGKW